MQITLTLVCRVQVGEFELNGPYFPGKLKGDQVTVCVRPEQLKASARNGRPGLNQIPAELKRQQERLAELVDLNIRTLQKIEAGKINILLTTLLRIQRALNCSWGKLLAGRE